MTPHPFETQYPDFVAAERRRFTGWRLVREAAVVAALLAVRALVGAARWMVGAR